MRNIYKITLSALFALALVACQDHLNLSDWTSQTNQLRTKALQQSQVLPYRGEQFQALKEYYAAISSMALNLKMNEGYPAQFNEALAKADIDQVCSQVFVNKSQWELMVLRCTKNRYFLCAEEVRAYPEMIKTIRENLNAEQRNRFNSSQACPVWTANL